MKLLFAFLVFALASNAHAVACKVDGIRFSTTENGPDNATVTACELLKSTRAKIRGCDEEIERYEVKCQYRKDGQTTKIGLPPITLHARARRSSYPWQCKLDDKSLSQTCATGQILSEVDFDVNATPTYRSLRVAPSNRTDEGTSPNPAPGRPE